jgi:hypothetical protein
VLGSDKRSSAHSSHDISIAVVVTQLTQSTLNEDEMTTTLHLSTTTDSAGCHFATVQFVIVESKSLTIVSVFCNIVNSIQSKPWPSHQQTNDPNTESTNLHPVQTCKTRSRLLLHVCGRVNPIPSTHTPSRALTSSTRALTPDSQATAPPQARRQLSLPGDEPAHPAHHHVLHSATYFAAVPVVQGEWTPPPNAAVAKARARRRFFVAFLWAFGIYVLVGWVAGLGWPN